jgi:hypothetical protein
MNAADNMQDDFSDKLSALQSVFSDEEEERPLENIPKNEEAI